MGDATYYFKAKIRITVNLTIEFNSISIPFFLRHRKKIKLNNNPKKKRLAIIEPIIIATCFPKKIRKNNFGNLFFSLSRIMRSSHQSLIFHVFQPLMGFDD